MPAGRVRVPLRLLGVSVSGPYFTPPGSLFAVTEMAEYSGFITLRSDPALGNATSNLTVPIVGSAGVGSAVAGVFPLEQPIAAAAIAARIPMRFIEPPPFV